MASVNLFATHIHTAQKRRQGTRQTALMECIWQQNGHRNIKKSKQVIKSCTIQYREQGMDSEDIDNHRTFSSQHTQLWKRRHSSKQASAILKCATKNNYKYKIFYIKKMYELNSITLHVRSSYLIFQFNICKYIYRRRVPQCQAGSHSKAFNPKQG